MDGVEALSDYYAASTGAVLSALVPKIILEATGTPLGLSQPTSGCK